MTALYSNMKRKPIVFLVAFLCLNAILKSQNLQDLDTIRSVKKAEYIKEDLTKFLQRKTIFPLDAVKNNIQGDVILSSVISKDGKLNNLKVLSSPDKLLSASSLISFQRIINEWNPCKDNGKPIDREYLIVFRYRIYLNEQPPDDNERAEKLIKKQKYEKAQKLLDAAITDNPFDYKLFESRSIIKEILDNAEDAKKDFEQSNKLYNEIIALVDVYAIGVTQVKTLTGKKSVN